MSALLRAADASKYTNRTTMDFFRYPIAAVAMPHWTKALKAVTLRESGLHLARTAIAVQRHRLLHGRAPESLAQLVPEFLREPPLDFMTGRPLLYEADAAGSFALYSAGEDGRDEDGLGDDIVWPQAGLPHRVSLPPTDIGLQSPAFTNAHPGDALMKLSRDLGLTVVFAPQVEDKLPLRFTLQLSNATSAKMMEAAMKRLGLSLVRGPKYRTICITTNCFPD